MSKKVFELSPDHKNVKLTFNSEDGGRLSLTIDGVPAVSAQGLLAQRLSVAYDANNCQPVVTLTLLPQSLSLALENPRLRLAASEIRDEPTLDGTHV